MQTPYWKVIVILLACFIGIVGALPNFLVQDYKFLPDQRINFGLDLRGGSYLLLKVDFDSYLKDQLEITTDMLRRELRKDQVGYFNLVNKGKELTLNLRDNQDASKLSSIIKSVNKDLSYNYDTQNGVVTLYFSPDQLDELQDRLVEQAREIIRMRVDESGTKEPSIQRQGKFNILLQVPGLQDPTDLKRILGKTAKMTFHVVDESTPVDQALKGIIPPGSRLISGDKDENGHQYWYIIKNKSVLSGDLLSDAKAVLYNGKPVVSFSLNRVGAKLFADVTRQNSGKKLAIVIDNKLISAPVINEPILGGSANISGNFTINSANELALLLRAGALPAPISVVEERTVGPNLGEDSIEDGTIASIIGISLIVIFMVVVYGLFGLFASVALVFNLVFIIAIMTFIQATLTLPGIAGIVLTMGMAVDANVLIFERIQEELSLKGTLVYAIDRGFAQAFATIFDSNITALIATFFLYEFGSGVVKGFAVTLAIGIISSMFTAISLTKLMIIGWLKLHKKPKVSA
jgi:preprotein translocase subunit SecD